MPWYLILALVCAVVAPFDALYQYIKATRRRDALKRREAEQRRAAEARREDPKP